MSDVGRQWVVLRVQLAVILLMAGVVVALSIPGWQSLLWGGGVSAVGGFLIAWRMARVSRKGVGVAGDELRGLYAFAFERYLVVFVLLMVGFVLLQLSSIALLGGFVVGQVVFVVAGLILYGSKLR